MLYRRGTFKGEKDVKKMTSFSQTLNQRRTKKRLTLRDAAEETGISFHMLWRYEHGIGLMEMSAGKLQGLADFLGWPVGRVQAAIAREAAQQKRAKGKRCKARKNQIKRAK